MYMYYAHYIMFILDLLDGSRDSIGYDTALLEAYSINVNITDSGTSREIVFEGAAPDSTYTNVRSISIS